MTLPGAMETTSGPLRDLHGDARKLTVTHPSIWDISLYNVFRSLDDADIGQAVCVVSNGPSPDAEEAASRLAHAFWDRREQFVDNLLSIDGALERIVRRRGEERFVLADMGDRVLAGAPGDSTAILAAVLAHPARLMGAAPVTDPETVEMARAAGVGRRIDGRLGGKMTPGFAPLHIEAKVVSLSDGNFAMRGPYRGGEWTQLGPTAVLRIDGRISALVTSKPGFTHDPAAFESNGIAIAAQDFVIAKSGYHFVLNFEGLATPLLLRTPGIGYYTKGFTTWRKGRFWPEHDVDGASFIGPLSFARSKRYDRT